MTALDATPAGLQAADPGEGVVADPAALAVTGIAPGQSVQAVTTITNGSDQDVLLGLAQSDTGGLLDGAHPLQVTYRWDQDGLASCDGAPVVPAGESLQVQVQATLPAEAGNEYQGLTATSELTYTATALVDGRCPGADDDGGTDDGSGPLAVTGGTSLLAWALVVVLVAAGVVLRLSTRRGLAARRAR